VFDVVVAIYTRCYVVSGTRSTVFAVVDAGIFQRKIQVHPSLHIIAQSVATHLDLQWATELTNYGE